MRRFDLHQDKAEKKSKELFYQMVVVQGVTLIVSGLVLGLFFTLMFYLMSERQHRRTHRRGFYSTQQTHKDLGPNQYLAYVGRGHRRKQVVRNKGPMYDYVINEDGRVKLPVVFGASYLAGMALMGFVIGIGGYYKFNELKGGGVKVAESLFATEINEETVTASHRQLLNIIQELAVASGIAVPKAFVLDNEPGINAFAAGHTYEDAVIVVTDGAVKRLSRDQMQGVVAHEFAHILNGDMARNMKLMAYTHGNFCLIELAEGMIGTPSLRTGSTRGSRRGQFSSDGGFPALGYILYPLGLLNSFVAVAFTAGMKRQGEYLADATAVELARYPRGLSEALMKIAGNKDKGRVRRKEASAMNYMFLVDGVNSQYRIFDSHPQIDRRILSLQPDWDGYYLYENEDELNAYGKAYDDVAELAGLAKEETRGKSFIPKELEQVAPVMIGAVAAMSADGTPPQTEQKEDTLVAGEDGVPDWLATDDSEPVEIDPNVLQLALHQEIAGLVLASLRLEQFDDAAAAQYLSQLNPMISGGISKIRPVITGLNDGQKMWMFDHALETVAKAPAMVRTLFADFVAKTSVEPSGDSDLAVWAWQQVVKAKTTKQEERQARYGEMKGLAAEVMVVLSAVTHTDSDSEMAAQYNFMRSVVHTGLETPVLFPADQCGVAEVAQALDQLSWLSARQRRKVVVACASGITTNRSVNLEEAWLMRAICCSLNFPSPKLYPGQALAVGI